MPPARWLLAVLVLSLTGCGIFHSTEPKTKEPLTSLPRPLTAAEQRVVAGGNDFAFGLLREVVRDANGANVFVSPISASLALGMTMQGARGTTLDGMKLALGFGGAPAAEIGPAYHDLMALLLALDDAVDLRLANSIWTRQGFPVVPEFYDVATRYFHAEARSLDFASPAAAATINDWVKTATAGKIPTIVDPPIGDEMVMYLINATYFHGSWRDRFDAGRTQDASFHTASGGTSTVRMMRRSGSLQYFEAPDARGVELAYGRTAFVMDVVLPAAGQSASALALALDTARWAGWLRQMHGVEVDLALPRFRLENDRLLNEALKRLGMAQSFVPDGADFSGISSTAGPHLYISRVRQKTYVDVNEEGTEAAAVTSVGVGVTSVPQRVTFTVDRPFLVAIRERFSGTILFLGVIAAP